MIIQNVKNDSFQKVRINREIKREIRKQTIILARRQRADNANNNSQIAVSPPVQVRSGLALPRDQVSDYLLAHQLNTDSRIKRKRGAMYQQAGVRYDYMCYNYDRCPFHLVQYDYNEQPETSYFIIIKPHLHAGEQTVREKFTTYPEVSAYLRMFRHSLQAKQLHEKASEYINKCLQLSDEITNQHRRQFPQYMLQPIAATDIDQIIPDLGMLRSRIQYFKKQDFLLADQNPDINETSNTVSFEKETRNNAYEPLSILHQVITSATLDQ